MFSINYEANSCELVKKRMSYTIRTVHYSRGWKRNVWKVQRAQTNQSSQVEGGGEGWVGRVCCTGETRARAYSTDLIRSRLLRTRVMRILLLLRNRRVPKCVHGMCEQNAFDEMCVCTPCVEFDSENDVGWESGVPDRQARNVEAEDQLTARVVRRAHATEQHTPALLSLGGARRLVRLRPRRGKKV